MTVPCAALSMSEINGLKHWLTGIIEKEMGGDSDKMKSRPIQYIGNSSSPFIFLGTGFDAPSSIHSLPNQVGPPLSLSWL